VYNLARVTVAAYQSHLHVPAMIGSIWLWDKKSFSGSQLPLVAVKGIEGIGFEEKSGGNVENVESTSSQLRCSFAGYLFGALKDSNRQGPHRKNTVDKVFCQQRLRCLNLRRMKLFAKEAKGNSIPEFEFAEDG
jgi:hypothetical protein